VSTYLRRYRLEPRRRTGRLLVGALIFMALLFAKVWQSTAANSLSMDRDRLRREVRALENRIRLSSELRVQAALREGLDHNALAGLGFQNPEPSAVVMIDLDDPIASPRRGSGGVVALLGGWFQNIRTGTRGATAEARTLPVSEAISR